MVKITMNNSWYSEEIYTCKGIGVTTFNGSKPVPYGDTFRIAPNGQSNPSWIELWKMPTLETYRVTPKDFKEFFTSTVVHKSSKHSGHWVVENMALWKKFKYCKECKEEVKE